MNQLRNCVVITEVLETKGWAKDSTAFPQNRDPRVRCRTIGAAWGLAPPWEWCKGRPVLPLQAISLYLTSCLSCSQTFGEYNRGVGWCPHQTLQSSLPECPYCFFQRTGQRFLFSSGAVVVPSAFYETGLMLEPINTLGHAQEQSGGTLGFQMNSGCTQKCMPLQALARGRSAQNITYADLSLLVSLILSLNL